MRFNRNFFHKLLVKSDSAFHAANFRQQPVVKTLAATQPAPAQIKRDSGHENQINFKRRNFEAVFMRFANGKFAGNNFVPQIPDAGR